MAKTPPVQKSGLLCRYGARLPKGADEELDHCFPALSQFHIAAVGGEGADATGKIVAGA